MPKDTIRWPVRTVLSWYPGAVAEDKIADLTCGHALVNPDARRRAMADTPQPKRRRCKECYDYESHYKISLNVHEDLVAASWQKVVGWEPIEDSDIATFTLACGHTNTFLVRYPEATAKLRLPIPCPECFQRNVADKLQKSVQWDRFVMAIRNEQEGI